MGTSPPFYTYIVSPKYSSSKQYYLELPTFLNENDIEKMWTEEINVLYFKDVRELEIWRTETSNFTGNDMETLNFTGNENKNRINVALLHNTKKIRLFDSPRNEIGDKDFNTNKHLINLSLKVIYEIKTGEFYYLKPKTSECFTTFYKADRIADDNGYNKKQQIGIEQNLAVTNPIYLLDKLKSIKKQKLEDELMYCSVFVVHTLNQDEPPNQQKTERKSIWKYLFGPRKGPSRKKNRPKIRTSLNSKSINF